MPFELSSSVLYLCASIIAFSCVAYELLLASYATFLMGASIFQYSLVISLMMMSMGIGAFLTNKIRKRLFETFLLVEILLAWCAAIAIPALYFCFSIDAAPKSWLLFFVVCLGLGIGMEIPLLNSINPSQKGLSRILFADYLGGFLGGLAFPLFLLPRFGFFRIGALLSVTNTLVGLLFLCSFKVNFAKRYYFWLGALVVTLLATSCSLLASENLRLWMERHFFRIIPY